MALRVGVHPQYIFDAEAVGLSEDDIDFMRTLVLFSAPNAMQLGTAFPHDETKFDIGLYELEQKLKETNTWTYYGFDGHGTFELLHLRATGPILHHHHGYRWVTRATELYRFAEERRRPSN